jgi:hypothetical protein
MLNIPHIQLYDDRTGLDFTRLGGKSLGKNAVQKLWLWCPQTQVGVSPGLGRFSHARVSDLEKCLVTWVLGKPGFQSLVRKK